MRNVATGQFMVSTVVTRLIDSEDRIFPAASG